VHRGQITNRQKFLALSSLVKLNRSWAVNVHKLLTIRYLRTGAGGGAMNGGMPLVHSVQGLRHQYGQQAPMHHNDTDYLSVQLSTQQIIIQSTDIPSEYQ